MVGVVLEAGGLVGDEGEEGGELGGVGDVVLNHGCYEVGRGVGGGGAFGGDGGGGAGD